MPSNLYSGQGGETMTHAEWPLPPGAGSRKWPPQVTFVVMRMMCPAVLAMSSLRSLMRLIPR
jgi:hypothetical protein